MENQKARLRNVAQAVWKLPIIKKIIVVALVAALAKVGVSISPEVAGGIIEVADTIDGVL